MEDDLDDIANVKGLGWNISDFFTPFEKGLLKAEKIIEKR
jgi:hypothetical protein